MQSAWTDTGCVDMSEQTEEQLPYCQCVQGVLKDSITPSRDKSQHVLQCVLTDCRRRWNTRFTEIILVKTRAQSNLLSQSILFARHSIHSIDYVHLDIYLKSSISNNIWMCREEERRGSAGSASPSKIPRGQPGSDERYPSNKVVRQLVINALLLEDVSTDVCTVQYELGEENIELRLQL